MLMNVTVKLYLIVCWKIVEHIQDRENYFEPSSRLVEILWRCQQPDVVCCCLHKYSCLNVYITHDTARSRMFEFGIKCGSS